MGRGAGLWWRRRLGHGQCRAPCVASPLTRAPRPRGSAGALQARCTHGVPAVRWGGGGARKNTERVRGYAEKNTPSFSFGVPPFFTPPPRATHATHNARWPRAARKSLGERQGGGNAGGEGVPFLLAARPPPPPTPRSRARPAVPPSRRTQGRQTLTRDDGNWAPAHLGAGAWLAFRRAGRRSRRFPSSPPPPPPTQDAPAARALDARRASTSR